MDLTSALLAEALKMGIGGLLLLSAVIWLARRDKQSDARADAANADLRKTIDANRDECSKREVDMAQRIRYLEDARHKETSDLLSRSVGALETVARIAEHMAKDDTGLHRALKGNHS